MSQKAGHDIQWRPRAVEDLAAIIRYIAQDNPARAQSFSVELKGKIGSLADRPHMGRQGIVQGTRELVIHRNYIAIYRVKPGIVEIVRIKHGAQNWP